jgi:septum formation protein
MMQLILASASPRRRELLAQAGYDFTVEAADVDESERPSESPADYVRRLAEEKAQAVFARHTSAAAQNSGGPSFAASSQRMGSNDAQLIVLGADTTVVLGGHMLAKPAAAADARRMLEQLSGCTHQVFTGIAAATQSGVISAVETTDVTFAQIPAAELELYCATTEPLDKAGAYGIQGYAARWIPRIDGDYFNVMGLPIARTVRLLEAARETMPR